MARAETDSAVVVVTGDVTMDWNLAREPLRGESDRTSQTRVSWQRGGAALLADMVETVGTSMGPGTRPMEVRGPETAPQEPIPPGDDSLNHSYALWSLFEPDAEGKGREPAWRVASFLGVDPARSDAIVRSEWARLDRDLPEAAVVALDDASLGFREHSQAGVWHARVADGRRPWVVLKAARPVAEGLLWEHLLTETAERLVVVMTIEDLRRTEVQVSRELSWERTAQDLFWELVHKPKVNALSRVAHTVISFGPAGVALISGPADPSGSPSCSLFFDPELVEGDWETRHPGRMMGSTNCLVAALIRELALSPEEPMMARGIQAGVAAQRRLHLEGYEERGPGRMELGFPHTLVADAIAAGETPLEDVPVPDPGASTEQRSWTILKDLYSSDLVKLATDAALDGPEAALPGVPLGRFGKLTTADRSEIEAFRSVRTLIAEYCRGPQSKPLSIGVFGPPGSGKSFAVEQVARSASRNIPKEPLEFNLSQLRSPDELADAFHLVRDQVLAGGVPLVFWDEIDTSLDGALGWLRYFLAPMQDGEFLEAQATHPIGRCIFVFAGGIYERVQDFGEDLPEERFREAKVPDFVSRLKGYVNVLGPNRQETEDHHHVIRRAILLRSMLRRRAPDIFDGDRLNVDRGVLRAFLRTTEYRHGARSMEAIVAMSPLSGKASYERSSLPAEPQLDLHVDATDFLSLVQQMDLEGTLLTRLAEAAHEVYCEGLRARGYEYGPEPDDERKISDSLVPWGELTELKKEQNRGTVRDMPEKLEQVGCLMVPARSELPAFAFTPEELETLAREEHQRWMEDLGEGWSHGSPTDKSRKVHEAYLPWDDLPESQKEKDRDLVRDIPKILARAGYAVVRSRVV